MTGACQSILIGHEGEISKVAFNPQGMRILTASSDKTARLWDAETGDCLQVWSYLKKDFAILFNRFLKAIRTRFLVVRSTTVVIHSSRDPRTTHAASGNVCRVSIVVVSLFCRLI
mmetsp:Transcript_11244/g.34561  ORF Transcript_11244/g.34561 Transcript_11244/m.34561 type:complete len:115 (-) Transcript_11244:234-578(-)